MSQDSVVAFLNRLKDDKALRGKVNPEGKTAEEYAASLVSVASEHGHEFTSDECIAVLQAVHDHHAKESRALGDEELEKAAGGLTSRPIRAGGVVKPALSSGTLTSLTSLMETGLLGTSSVIKKK